MNPASRILTVFLLSYIAIYGTAHFYLFMKIAKTYSPVFLIRISVAAFMALMIAAPIISRLLEGQGQLAVARIIAYGGYLWMGVVFLFVSASILLDWLRGILWLVSRLTGTILPHNARGMTTFLLPFIAAVAMAVYGFAEARNVGITRLTIETDKLPSGDRKIRLIQISDIHLGLMNGPARLREILNLVKNESPDIIVATGDLIDGDICNMNEVSSLLNEFEAPLGKFAVTGNHEFYAGLDRALQCLGDGGFTVLRNRSFPVNDFLTLVGIDDPAGRRFNYDSTPAEDDLLPKNPADAFTVLLKHRPSVESSSLGRFDLQLSGHTHRGQIFPFALFTRLAYPFNSGYFSLDGGTSRLYVSRGAGTWGPPIRFLSPPEITVIDVVRSS
ncbi:MAG: metallophosphoesterase [Deltaproteobacteria bacterium]|nr:metallophosphoesterase [Deltaproteobacteria bacterium]